MSVSSNSDQTTIAGVPEMLWTQDDSYVYLTVMASQANSLSIDLQPHHFKFHSQTTDNQYQFSFAFQAHCSVYKHLLVN